MTSSKLTWASSVVVAASHLLSLMTPSAWADGWNPKCVRLSEDNVPSVVRTFAPLPELMTAPFECSGVDCHGSFQFFGREVVLYSSNDTNPLEACFYSSQEFKLEDNGPCTGRMIVLNFGVQQPSTTYKNRGYFSSIVLTYILPSRLKIDYCAPLLYPQIEPRPDRITSGFSERNARIEVVEKR